MLNNFITIVAAVASLAVASVIVPHKSLIPPPTEVVQDDKETRRTTPPRMPGVFVKDENGVPQPLAISKLDVDVQVTGTMARTTLDITVYNPHKRVLEGEFSFPLQDGQTVARFALDINGKLRDAVVVPKTKARETFEEVIRTKIDPALLEWTRDNSFKTRIYPIPAQGTRRVVIAYEQPLVNTPTGLNYSIPFAYEDPIKAFSFKANVAAFGTRPSLTGGLDTVQFSPRGRNFEVAFERTDILLNRPFTIAVPVSLDEDLVRVTEFNGTKYFGAFLTIPVAERERPTPKTISLLWDASLSGTRRNVQAEYEALDAFFERVKDVEVRYASFSNTLRDQGVAYVKDGNWDALRANLSAMPFDGATQLGAVPMNNNDVDLTILVSDGINTLGDKKPSTGATPIFVLSSGVPADHDVLHAIAKESGGAVIPVRDTEPAAAVNKILGAQRMITSIDVLRGSVKDIRPTGMIPVERVTSITGKVLSGGVTLQITSSVAGDDIRYDLVMINEAQHLDSTLTVSRMWANRELQRLSADRVRNAETITALGMEFTIVTPNTSLLVLERIRDYVRFNIKPPANEPELVKQFTEQRKRWKIDSAAVKKAQQKRIERMVARRKQLLAKGLNADSIVAVELKRRAAALERRRQDSINKAIAAADMRRRYSKPATLTGVVRDSANQPIPGVRIVVVGTTRGAMSNAEGKYKITGIPYGENDYSLNALGYQTKTYRFTSMQNGSEELDFHLQRDYAISDSVVITNRNAVLVVDDRQMVRSTVIGTERVLGKEMEVQWRDSGESTAPDVERGTIDFFEDNVGGAAPVENDAAEGEVLDDVGRDNVATLISTQPGIKASGNNFTVRGSRTTETQVLVDGLEVTDQFTGGLGNTGSTESAAMPSPLSTEEVKHLFGAEYGRAVRGNDNTVARDTVNQGPSGGDLTGTYSNPLAKKSKVSVSKQQDRMVSVELLKKLTTEDLYTTYLQMRQKHFNTTVFYVDISDILVERGEHELALRVISNLAEIRGEDHRDLRILGHRLMQMNEPALAVKVFEDVMRIRDEEPQSYRDLALAHEANGQFDKSAECFLDIMSRKWHSRFPEVELIAAMEYSRLVAEHRNNIKGEHINDDLLLPVNVGLRVVLTWDADNCDMDLWVEDPLGEVCKYNHRKTKIGGNMSRDLTGGYGPEEFILPVAAEGTYKIKVHYYGNRQQNVDRPTTIQVNMFTNYGAKEEDHQAITMRLSGRSKVVNVGEISVN